MRKQELLKQYQGVAGKIGFRENKKKKGWIPRLGPNDYRSVIRHGWLGEKPAVLEVSPHLDLVEIGRDFRYYQKEKTGDGLLIPRVLRSGRMGKAQFLVQEAVEGERIIDVNSYSFTDRAQKVQVVGLYWNTVNGFPEFPSITERITAVDYFLERLAKWTSEGMKVDSLLDTEDKAKAVQFIFDYCGDMEMEPFFAHFGNTDIIRTADRQYFILGAPIVAKPVAVGFALWLWNATLYASLEGNISEKWFRELSDWVKVFEDAACGNYKPVYVRVNFLERMLCALLVDLPRRRSPFDGKNVSGEDLDRAEKFLEDIFREVLYDGFE